jgi:hypothetical protein
MADHGGHSGGHSGHGGGHGAERGGGFFRSLLELSPLLKFGAMLTGVFNKDGVSNFLSEATKTLDFFGAAFAGGGGGGGQGGGGHGHH